MNEINEIVRCIRLRHDLSQNGFAKIINSNPSTICKLEKDSSYIGINLLQKIINSKALNIKKEERGVLIEALVAKKAKTPLERIRLRRNNSQQQLAKILRVSQSFLSRGEKHLLNAYIERLKKLKNLNEDDLNDLIEAQQMKGNENVK